MKALTEVQRDRISQRNQNINRGNRSTSGSGTSGDGSIPDMGILKGLQGVGVAVKNQFDSLTSKISALTSDTGDSNRSRNEYGEEDNAEMNPLVTRSGYADGNDDDEEEAVEFLTSPHARHRGPGSNSNDSSGVINFNKKDK